MSKVVIRALIAIGLIIMLAHTFIYFYYSIDLMRFPFDYDQGEGYELVAVQYLSEGRSPYTNNDEYPYFSDLYPLGFHVVLVPFAWIFGDALWYGRLVSFLGTLITAGAIGIAIQRESKWRSVAVLMGLAFLASNYIYHIGPLFRQHYFMVMLETLAMVTLANYFEITDPKIQRRKLWLGLGFLLMALYTKQLAYATAAPIFVWLFIRDPRRSITAGIAFTIAGALVFGLLMLLTEGYWWKNAFAANVNPYIYSQFWGLAKQFVRLHWVLLLMSMLMTLYELYFARLSLYTIWWVAVTVNTITAGKWGAGDSYFATSIAASCILSGIFITRCLDQNWTFAENYLTRLVRPFFRLPANGYVSLMLVIVYGLTVIKLPTSGFFEPISRELGITPKPAYRYPLYDAAGWTVGYAVLGHLPSEQDYDNGWKIVERVKETDQPVLSEDGMFNILAGKEVVGNPVHLKNLYENKLFDPTALVQDIENHRFGLIILRAAFYPDPVVAAILDAYYITESIDMNGFAYQLWKPEPTWTVRQQIRNYLEGSPTASLTVSIPETVENPDEWIEQSLARWAWNLEVQNSAECEEYRFTRREKIAHINICEGQLVILLE